ncbi:MAG: alpha/beta fold hydrolase [Gammaproteobacteria bacterium]|nr:alpha/beta fold hydrolase [Gammaproteobacteria bacterium]
MKPAIEKQSYWLRSGDFELATHAHFPRTESASTAVLICSTVGFEAIHAYRCMVRLGDALADAGLAAFRFDFAGTGNSSGNADAADLVAAWQDNIVDQVQDLKQNWGFANVAVVGFRLGAPLLASVVNELDVVGLAFWEPVTRGRTFVREIHAVAQFAEDPVAGDSDKVESGGFVFTADTIESIGKLSLDAGAIPADVPVLLISRGKNARLNAKSLENRNPFEELRSLEYDRMICEPHYTELPVDSIACIERWHSSIDKKVGADVSPPELRVTASVTGNGEHRTVNESSFRTARGSLFGIVARPADYVAGSTPTVVLPNAGSVCTVGPNRVYVQIARALAASGMEVVRFDLRNLGDSVTGDVEAANAPYPDSAGEDVSHVLEHCRSSFGSSSFILAGLCSGSHTSYHFALAHDDQDVREIVLINPLTYYYTAGMSLDNPLQHRTVRNAKSYVRSARRAENWRRLLTGQVNYRRLAGFALRVFLRLVRNGVRRVSSLWTHHPLSRMDEDLTRLQQRGLKVSYVFSDTDPGYWIARVDSPNAFRQQESAGKSAVTFIKDADHTMSRADNRAELIERLREHLQPASAG